MDSGDGDQAPETHTDGEAADDRYCEGDPVSQFPRFVKSPEGQYDPDPDPEVDGGSRSRS